MEKTRLARGENDNRTSDANYAGGFVAERAQHFPPPDGGRVFSPPRVRACIEKAIKARHDFVRQPREHLSRSSSREISRSPRVCSRVRVFLFLFLPPPPPPRSINCLANNTGGCSAEIVNKRDRLESR